MTEEAGRRTWTRREIALDIGADVLAAGVELAMASQARFIETLDKTSLQGCCLVQAMSVADFEKWMDTPPGPAQRSAALVSLSATEFGAAPDFNTNPQ